MRRECRLNIANRCEMKFYHEDFTVNGDYNQKSAYSANKPHEELPKKYAVHSTLITTYGLTYNEFSGAFQQVITLEDLFS